MKWWVISRLLFVLGAILVAMSAFDGKGAEAACAVLLLAIAAELYAQEGHPR